MSDDRTTLVVQQYLLDLGAAHGQSQAEPIVRNLVSRSVTRLHLLCRTMLMRSYPRLMQPPLNLQSEEMLSAVVDRLLKAMREIRPGTVREFFGLANQHIRWELNDLARRLDSQTPALELQEAFVAAAESSGSTLSPNASRMLDAIERLPEEEREVFELVRIQGMTHTEAAELIGVSAKTIQRRLNRSIMILSEQLTDLRPALAPQVNEES